MKTFIMTLALAVSPIIAGSAWGAGTQGTKDVQYLVVSQTDGSESKFAIAKAPVVAFRDGNLQVSCDGDVLELSMAGVSNYHFVTEQVPTGIESVATEPSVGEVRPTIAFGEASFRGLRAGAAVTVYTIDGRAVKTVKADAEGNASVALGDLEQGVYILRAGGQSIKVYNK
ncbi:T9SS type A sorting domain-containing protein [Prevotella sp. kh1p2]|jgi:hypothetical protein|uniref:T9SS type A sorting domain-containing protein n=1 Tax=Prevotella sp. kh1p2 TaxID=1761883 RepID=UPI0008B2554F|nr:T9SS type A sorting domain-containing protein [Prevotella sp. kh1p2]SES68698.1 Por secretion system C-terminal sorting domain-containing protein [Prevotella sp. kh1p2]SNU10276.1 Por secretion system C-terminal sorting domain-containing protein [Prevotellaceae bacterium KH2P17]